MQHFEVKTEKHWFMKRQNTKYFVIKMNLTFNRYQTLQYRLQCKLTGAICDPFELLQNPLHTCNKIMKTSNHSKTIENEIPKKLNIQVQVGVAYIDGVIEHTSNESSNSFLRYLFFFFFFYSGVPTQLFFHDMFIIYKKTFGLEISISSSLYGWAKSNLWFQIFIALWI